MRLSPDPRATRAGRLRQTKEEVKDVAIEQISIGTQYINVSRAKEPTVCTC